jgi:hypothetical protein
MTTGGKGVAALVPGLLLAQVSIDAHVSRGARQAFVLAVGNVLVRVGVDVLLGQAEVNDMDDLRLMP